MTDIRQSKNYAKYMESIGWIVENGIFIRKLWFTAVVKAQRFSKINLGVIKRYRPFLVKLEPLKEINLPGFKKDNWPLLPTKTLVLDLDSLSLDSLPKDTRYEIRKAISAGLHPVRGATLSDTETFYKILQETMELGHWSVPIRKEVTNIWRSFQPRNSQIIFTFVPQYPLFSRSPLLPIAGCLLIWDGDTAHYMYAANTARGRELGAAYLTLWEAIKFCQKKGLKYLDLEGIYDERYPSQSKHWQGFTKFKMGWGGKVVEYPGSWTKYLFLKSLK